MILKQDYPSADEAWNTLILEVIASGKTVYPRGLECKEILAYTSSLDMNYPIVTIRPKLGYKFMAAEAWWILSGRNDVASIVPYSKKIAEFSNDGIRFDGAYGPMIVDQLRYVVDTLHLDPHTRQAVAGIWRPNPRPSKDFPCTLSAQWMIREDGCNIPRLHCFDTMRSSDSWLGIPYDWFNFTMLSAYIAIALRHRQAMVGNKPNIQLGALHLTAASQHLYMQNVEGAKITMANGVMYKQYKSLQLENFNHPEELIDFLSLCKDGMQGDGAFMSEFKEPKC